MHDKMKNFSNDPENLGKKTQKFVTGVQLSG